MNKNINPRRKYKKYKHAIFFIIGPILYSSNIDLKNKDQKLLRKIIGVMKNIGNM
jgi:hypothetical protein